MRRYTVLLVPDPADGGYTVTVPILPGCITESDTLDQALEHARDAIRLYLADREAAGEPTPEEVVPLALAIVEA